jgi:hypothetical protein
MTFRRGESGNPAGRPRKPRVGPDRLRANLLRQAPELLSKLTELALGGDVAAAREILGRCLPPLRPRDAAVTIDLGPDLAEASKAVLAGMAVGALTPGEAASVASTIGALARTAELVEFEKRLSALEADLN